MQRLEFDPYFLNIASAVSLRATCLRKKVGAILVKDNRILSTGYNGSASKADHCLDVGCLMIDGHCKRTIHAEVNAFLHLEHINAHKAAGSTLYTTASPCASCYEYAVCYGVTRIVCSSKYSDLIHLSDGRIKNITFYDMDTLLTSST